MADAFRRFERIARSTYQYSEREAGEQVQLHPFDVRNIHAGFPPKVRQLFDDGHFPQATFEAFKFIDKLVLKHFGGGESGFKLMMAAFDRGKAQSLKLTPLSNASEIDEQDGYRFIFAGAAQAIRNPRGHEVTLTDDVDTCLDHLAFASMLIRRMEAAGFGI